MKTEEDELTFDYEEIVRETPDAVLLLIGTEIWLPKGQIELDRTAKTVYVPEWLAIKKGLV